MSDFTRNFNPYRKDVVYGRTEARADYIEDFFESPELKQLERMNKEKFGVYTKGYYINDYNEVITKGDLSYPSEPKLFTNSKALEHYKALLEKSKFAPINLTTSSWQAFAKGDNTIQSDSTRTREEWTKAAEVLAVRRGCKFGIEFISSFVGAWVHYALDGIDMDKVMTKGTSNLWTGKVGVSITTSELRYLFREWGRYRNSKIIFYLHQSITAAPWVSEPQRWLPYAVARVEKYREQLKNTNAGQLGNFDKHAKKDDGANAIPWFHDMKVGLGA